MKDSFGNRIKQRPLRIAPIKPGCKQQQPAGRGFDHGWSRERPRHAIEFCLQIQIELLPGQAIVSRAADLDCRVDGVLRGSDLEAAEPISGSQTAQAGEEGDPPARWL